MLPGSQFPAGPLKNSAGLDCRLHAVECDEFGLKRLVEETMPMKAEEAVEASMFGEALAEVSLTGG